MDHSYPNIQTTTDNEGYPVPSPPNTPPHIQNSFASSPSSEESSEKDIVIGISNQEEKNRTHSIITMINVEAYSPDDYGSVYIGALKVNNFIYKYTFLILSFLFTVTLGLMMSFFVAWSVSALEFANLYAIRPTLKMFAILLQAVKSLIAMVADSVAPLLELVFPGSFKHWKTKAI